MHNCILAGRSAHAKKPDWFLVAKTILTYVEPQVTQGAQIIPTASGLEYWNQLI